MNVDDNAKVNGNDNGNRNVDDNANGNDNGNRNVDDNANGNVDVNGNVDDNAKVNVNANEVFLMTKKTKYIISICIFIAVLVIDQIIKVSVKTGMYLGERNEITSWFSLVFVENEGMAFGWKLWGGKLFLTLFRIVAVSLIGWFIYKEIKRERPIGYIVCLSLIMAGAAGNIIDCLFYGLIFNSPEYPEVAQFVPWGEGYGDLLFGKVVDMFYFPLVEWDMPSWVPVWGGEHCIFFSPIFNFADAAISCGIVALLLFYYKILNAIGKEEEADEADKLQEVESEDIN